MELLAINFLIASISMWVILHVNARYLQPTLKNKQRFKLYRLRDRLSLLAMKGEIDEDAEEYLILIRIINNAIRTTGSFRVTEYLRFIWRLSHDVQLKEKINSITRKIDGSECSEYCEIASETFNVLHDMLKSDTRVLRYLFLPIIVVIGSILAILHITTEVKKYAKVKKDFIEETNETLTKYSSSFCHAG